MASIGGVRGNNMTSSLYNSANVISGLASGLDTEGMIEGLVQSYQTKIQNLSNKATKIEWKQEAYRSIINKMYSFGSKYTSYSSATNLMSASFFNSAIKVATMGANKDKVSASGRTDSDIKLTSVKQLATSARYSTASSLKGVSDDFSLSAEEAIKFDDNFDTGTPLLYASDDTSIQIDVAADGCVHVAASPFGSFDTALRGSYQTANVRTAISALASLRDAGYNLSDDAVARGFLRVADTLHGRWEMHNGVLCDSGHNEAAWRHTSAYLAERGSRITAIIGFCADKDVAAIADMLPSTVEYYCVAAHTPRAIPAAELQAMLAGRGLHAKAFASVAEAIEEARKKNAAEIFLGGSFYIVAEYL